MAQIKEEQLKELSRGEAQVKTLQLEIGKVEIYKKGLLQAYQEENDKLEKIKAEIYQEFGKVSIDLKTCEYQIIGDDTQG